MAGVRSEVAQLARAPDRAPAVGPTRRRARGPSTGSACRCAGSRRSCGPCGRCVARRRRSRSTSVSRLPVSTTCPDVAATTAPDSPPARCRSGSGSPAAGSAHSAASSSVALGAVRPARADDGEQQPAVGRNAAPTRPARSGSAGAAASPVEVELPQGADVTRTLARRAAAPSRPAADRRGSGSARSAAAAPRTQQDHRTRSRRDRTPERVESAQSSRRRSSATSVSMPLASRSGRRRGRPPMSGAGVRDARAARRTRAPAASRSRGIARGGVPCAARARTPSAPANTRAAARRSSCRLVQWPSASVSSVISAWTTRCEFASTPSREFDRARAPRTGSARARSTEASAFVRASRAPARARCRSSAVASGSASASR